LEYKGEGQPITLSPDTVLGLAPGAASAAAAKALAQSRDWRALGRSEGALWGECQGAALYQVRVDLDGLVAKCSCPSGKHPCKHALALMLMAASTPERLSIGEPPTWVGEWLAQRTRTAEKRAAKAARGEATVDVAAQAKRAEQRSDRVRAGLDALELWMQDLVRHGFASIEAQGAAPWLAQAARLVDAQAPGLASRVRGLAGISRSRPEWAEDLVAQLGQIALLIQAYRRIDDLDAPIKADVRQLIGWTMKEDEVIAAGDLVEDDWLVIGQRADSVQDDRIRIQRTWLLGLRSNRAALILQFAAGDAGFAESFTPGTQLPAVLAFWPSAMPQRALLLERKGQPTLRTERLPGAETIEAFLGSVAQTLARQPWMHRVPCVLRDVVPVRAENGEWSIVDRQHAALPLKGVDEYDHWYVLAISGGHPVDLVSEWNGRSLRPLFVRSATDAMMLFRAGGED